MFVRNSWKIVARKPHGITCARRLVQDLCNFFRSASEEGREVPFNGLQVQLLSENAGRCLENICCAGLIPTNLPGQVELRHLEVTYTNDVIRDEVYEFCMNLIRDHATEIQYLTTHTALILEDLVHEDYQPRTNFPKLEELTILLARTNDWESIFRGMAARSPNLKMLFVNAYPRFFDIIPEDYWPLSGYLEICVEDLLEEGSRRATFEKFVEQKPELRKLEIYECRVESPAEERIVKNFFTQLFQSCTESLKELHIYQCHLHTVQLSRTPLKNLSYLSLTITDERSLAWLSLVPINACTSMPQLEEVLIVVKFRYVGTRIKWPPLYLGPRPARRAYSSVRKLGLDFKNANVNLYALSAIFPNVSSLTMDFYRSRCIHCGEIWEFWPNLEELKIIGEQMTLSQNFDSEFCGIDDAEAAELRELAEDQLLTVQLAPVYPSLLTMRSKSFKST